MCLVYLAWQPGQPEPVTIAANRDEFRERRSAPMHVWLDRPILGGRALDGGRGTWMGVAAEGPRWAFLTNVRELRRPGQHQSRGRLVADWLDTTADALDYLGGIDLDAYRGFNLVIGDAEVAYVISNRAKSAAPTALTPGIHGFTNGPYDGPQWPKVAHGLDAFTRAARQGRAAVHALMLDEAPHADQLPQTGMGDAVEQVLSSRFVTTTIYGTLTTTTATLTPHGWVTCEYTHDTARRVTVEHLHPRTRGIDPL